MSTSPRLKFEVIAVTSAKANQTLGVQQLLNKMSGCSGLWTDFSLVEISAESVFEPSTNTKLSVTNLVSEEKSEAGWRGFQCTLEFDEAHISVDSDIRMKLMEG